MSKLDAMQPTTKDVLLSALYYSFRYQGRIEDRELTIEEAQKMAQIAIGPIKAAMDMFDTRLKLDIERITLGMDQLHSTIIGKYTKGEFRCGLCEQQRTHASWEDTEIFFNSKYSVHLGCLQDHYREMILKTTLALENIKSAIEANHDGNPLTVESVLQDAIANLKGALRTQ